MALEKTRSERIRSSEMGRKERKRDRVKIGLVRVLTR
jgi:hypothetical protein